MRFLRGIIVRQMHQHFNGTLDFEDSVDEPPFGLLSDMLTVVMFALLQRL